MIQACQKCGIGFDLDHVPANPFKRCPNPNCGAPLDADAVEHTYVEAHNPSNPNDTARLDAKAQLHNFVADHGGDTATMQEKIAAGIIAAEGAGAAPAERKIQRKVVALPTAASAPRAFGAARAPGRTVTPFGAARAPGRTVTPSSFRRAG